MRTIKQFDPIQANNLVGYHLVTDSQEIKEVIISIGASSLLSDVYGSLFVRIGEGEYLSVYGCYRSVPGNSADCYHVFGEFA